MEDVHVSAVRMKGDGFALEADAACCDSVELIKGVGTSPAGVGSSKVAGVAT